MKQVPAHSFVALCLVAAGTTRATAVSAVHASSSGSLDARAASEASLELEESTADLVLHGRSSLLMVDSDGGSVGASAAGGAAGAAKDASTRLGGSAGGGGVVGGAGRSATTAAKDGATTGRAGGGGVAVGSCKRHVGWFEGVGFKLL